LAEIRFNEIDMILKMAAETQNQNYKQLFSMRVYFLQWLFICSYN